MPRRSRSRSRPSKRRYKSGPKSRSKSYRRRSRSNPSRGWRKASPQKGRERNLIMQQCGSRAFLLPSQLKFPVVKAYRSRKGRSPCRVSCAGLLSAYRRARQRKYPGVAKKALSRAKRARCTWV